MTQKVPITSAYDDYAWDVHYHEHSIRTVRTLAAVEIILNVGLYALLSWRWRFTENIHWNMCNFLASETIRSVAAILHGIIKTITLPVMNRQLTDPTNTKLTTDLVTFLNTKAVLDSVTEVGVFSSLTFALITFYYYYKQLKNPCMTERCGTFSYVASAIIWSSIVVYFTAITTVRIRLSAQCTVLFWDRVIVTIFDSCFILTSISLLVVTGVLYYQQFNVEGISYHREAKFFLQETKEKISYLFLLIPIVMVPAVMSLYVVGEELKWSVEMSCRGSYDRQVVVVTDLCGIWISLLAICWPYIWFKLDDGLSSEYQKFLTWFRKEILRRVDPGPESRIRVFRRRHH